MKSCSFFSRTIVSAKTRVICTSQIWVRCFEILPCQYYRYLFISFHLMTSRIWPEYREGRVNLMGTISGLKSEVGTESRRMAEKQARDEGRRQEPWSIRKIPLRNIQHFFLSLGKFNRNIAYQNFLRANRFWEVDWKCWTKSAGMPDIRGSRHASCTYLHVYSSK